MNRVVFSLSLKVILLLLTIAGLELVLRITNYPYLGCSQVFEPDETKLGRFDADLGWVWRSNSSFYSRGVAYHFDAFGLRTDAFRQAVDFEKPRILFIGDSVTFGYGLNHAQTFPVKIGTLLDDKFTIVNAAVEGYGTDQSLLRLQQLVDYIRPSAVVMTYIADHSHRNLAHDRRLSTQCLRFLGTKPTVFAQVDGLLLKQPAHPIDESHEVKLALALESVLQRARSTIAIESGYDLKLSAALLQGIAATRLQQHYVPTYFIYYDNRYTATTSFNDTLYQYLFVSPGLRSLALYNWAADSEGGDYYVLPGEDDFHPNGKLTGYIAEQFVNKFGSELKTLATSVHE